MNVQENEIYADMEAIPDRFKSGFEQIPRELSEDARKVLDGREHVKVDRSTKEGKKLLAWSRNRRKAQRKARKKNRAR